MLTYEFMFSIFFSIEDWVVRRKGNLLETINCLMDSNIPVRLNPFDITLYKT